LRKREFTSFDVAAVTQELKQTILGSRVSNIYQPNPKTLLFKLHKADKPTFQLVLEAGKRLHLTSYTLEKPTVPPAFCMALRKHLRNAWLTNIEQYEFERTITFTFKTKSGDVKLVLELFGEGNIILISEKGEILQALIYKRMRDRNILRGETFIFAPSSGKNPFKISKEELTTTLADFGDVEVVRAIARHLSIGGLYAEEALLRAGVEKTKPCNALNSFEIENIHKSLQALLSHILDGKFEPSIILDSNGEFIDVTPFKLKRYEKFNHKPYGNFNEALDDFYARIAAVEKTTVSVETEKLKHEAERLKRVIESQEKALDEAKAEAEKAKKIGDAIYAHAGEIQILMEKFSAGKGAGKQWSQIVSEVSAEKKAGIVPSVFFESFDAKNLVVHVCVNEARFSLGLRRKLFDEAGRFYERSKRARQKLEGIKAALEESRKKLAEITAKIEEAEALKHIKPAEAIEELEKRKIKHKEWFEKFRWFTSSDGFLVVAGKDAVSNEVLIKKYTEPNDIVFHADIVGAPFVVIKTEGKKPSEQTLKEAGEFAAAYSRGWRESFASTDVYWVKPNQISKTAPSGEYVPHGAFVVSGKRNWMRNVPLKVAVGIVAEKNGEIKLIGEPVDAVKTKTKIHAIIAPGEQSGKELLKHVLKVLAMKTPKELREKISKASVEEIREFIPYGKGRVLTE
jgi:predicted ribosome quality control (RQC) complex YloA/Tae2 family protein